MVEYAGKMTKLHLCEFCQPWKRLHDMLSKR